MALVQKNTGDVIAASDMNTIYELLKTTNAKEWITFTHKGADIASAGTLSLGGDGNYFDVTGTTGITAISSRQAGTMVILQFDGAVTLTHSASLVLQGAANVTTAAGDVLVFIADSTTVWRQIGWLTAGGFVTLTGSETLTNKTLTTPTIANFTNAAHDHGDADDGGAVLIGGTPAVVLGTAAAAGAATTYVRTDDTLLAFDATVPVTQAFGDAAAAGSATVTARRDHKHGMPATPASGDLYNFLTNPGFEVWQRGAGAFTADGAYTADRWLMDEIGTDTLSVTREGTTKSTNSLYSLAAVFVLGNGAGATQIYQQLSINANDENHQLLGQVISARIAVRTATATAARTFIATDGTGGTTNYSGYHTGGSTFENLDVVNITVPSDATYVRVGAAFAASATVYMDNAALAISATAPTYKGLTRADEWERCQRYYEDIDGYNGTSYSLIVCNGYTAAAEAIAMTVPYNTRKAVAAPTVTKIGTWATLNSGQVTVAGSPGAWALACTITTSGAGMAYNYTDTAGDGFDIEANP